MYSDTTEIASDNCNPKQIPEPKPDPKEPTISSPQVVISMEMIAIATRIIELTPIVVFHFREIIRYKSGLKYHKGCQNNNFKQIYSFVTTK